MAGGTALALQIGHRISIDFDLFCQEINTPNLLRKVRRIFKGAKIEVILKIPGQLSVKIDGVKIDFVEYKFPVILRAIKFRGMRMLQASEIAAMKAYALNFRGTLKDYVDLYFVLKEKHITLQKIKKIAEKKYKSEFNFRLLLEQIVYFKDLRREEIEFLKKEVPEKQMQKFFEQEIRKMKL